MTRFDRTTRTLVAFAALNVVLSTALVGIVARRELSQSSAAYTAKFALGHAADDSWKPMLLALDEAHGSEPIYRDLFFRRNIKFQYPPSSLLPLDLLQSVLRHSPSLGLLNGISWLSVLLLAAVVPAIYLRLTKDQPIASLDRRVQALTIAFLTLTFYPITRGFALGQIQTWLTCLFAASVLAWVYGREMLAGVLIGAVVSVKPQLGLLLIWAAVHRRGRFLIGSSVAVVVLESVSLWRYGLANQLDYLSVLSFLSAHGESFFANQSVNGLLARALRVGPNLEWDAHGFPPYHPVVYFGTLVSSMAMILLALLWRRKDDRAESALLKFLVASLLFTMASPIAWEHHYGILAPIYAAAFALLPAARAPLAISYVLTADVFPVANRAADTPFNFVQSYLFAGALVFVAAVFLRPTIDCPSPAYSKDSRTPEPATPSHKCYVDQ